MDEDKTLIAICGIGIILTFLIIYLRSNSTFFLICITLGIMTLIYGFFSEDSTVKVTVSYVLAMFCVIVVQWFLVIYIFYNSLYIGDFYLSLIIALLSTMYIVNQIRNKYFKSTEIITLKDNKKLKLVFIGLIIIIGSLAGFDVYCDPIFLYGITLGLMVSIFGFYHNGKKVKVSWTYAIIMIFLLILQFSVLFYYITQFSVGEWTFTMTLSLNIALFLSIQLYVK